MSVWLCALHSKVIDSKVQSCWYDMGQWTVTTGLDTTMSWKCKIRDCELID